MMHFLRKLMFWRTTPPVDRSEQDRYMQGIASLMTTDVTGAVKMALNKLKNEPAYPGRPRLWDMADGPVKRREVHDWAVKYAKSMGHDEDISDWHINFMIEFLVGQEKGRL